MKKWRIFNIGLHIEIIVYADSFDKALLIAWETNPKFNGGQVIG